MSNLTSKQRKLVYLCSIFALLAVVIWLGMPATDTSGKTGGKIARLRHEYQLGESTLGDVDPSGAAANLVLLGLRGPAVTTLHLQAMEEKETKNWAKLRSSVNSIITLQPHFKEIWRFQGWNLAYNVSAEWDDVEDRFYWVKEGIKFVQDGSRRNTKYAELPWVLGRMTGSKMGESDERVFFRKYFLTDPDTDLYGEDSPDPQINPEGKDNYLVSRDHYLDANVREEKYGQEIQTRMIFRSYPAKAYQEYAEALQKEGVFGDEMRLAWESAFEAWTVEYGQEEVDCQPLYQASQATPRSGKLKLESDVETITNLANLNEVPEELQAEWTDRYQKMVHYTYWRRRTEVEREELTVAAHREIYDGKRLYREGKTSARGEDGELPSEARAALEQGMRKLETVLKDPRFVQLQTEDEMLEEAMLAVRYWRSIYELNGAAIPADYPLKWLWDGNQDRIGSITQLWEREKRGL